MLPLINVLRENSIETSSNHFTRSPKTRITGNQCGRRMKFTVVVLLTPDDQVPKPVPENIPLLSEGSQSARGCRRPGLRTSYAADPLFSRSVALISN